MTQSEPMVRVDFPDGAMFFVRRAECPFIEMDGFELKDAQQTLNKLLEKARELHSREFMGTC